MGESVAVLDQELDIFQRHPDLVALSQRFGDVALLPVAETTPVYPQLFNAEAIPEVAARRADARQAAHAIYETRMQHLRDGDYHAVPPAVDPLSNAARVVEAEQRYGRDSDQYRMWYNSLTVDSSRLLAEAGSKHAAAYFPMLEQRYDEAAGGYTFEGRVLQEMVGDGITPIAEAEENDYRIGEYVEEAIAPVVRTLGRTALGKAAVLPAEQAPEHAHKSVHTIAECADWAQELYDRVKDDEAALIKADFQGYVPKRNKLMIRTFRYPSTEVRYLEQMAVSGEWITPAVILEFKYRTGVLERGQTPDKITRRGTQMVDFEGRGALDILRTLDDIAGEFSGKNIFKGEEVAPDHPKDYTAIPAEAAAHEQQFEAEKKVLTDHLIELEKKGTDHFLSNALVANFVQDLLLEKVKADPEQAEVIFDKQSSERVRDLIAHHQAGNDEAAADLWLRIKAAAPKVEFCTGGSCGLESLNIGTAAGMAAKQLLGIKGDGEILRDTQRACPDCHEYEVVYDSKTGSKACLNCKKTEIKK